MPPAPRFPDLRLLTERYARLWNGAETSFPAALEVVPEARRRAAEHKADATIEELERRCEDMPPDAETRRAWRAALRRDFRDRVRTHLSELDPRTDSLAPWVEALASDALLETTRCFLLEARAFDEKLTPEELFQALRNVWIAGSVELYLGHEPESVALTPSVFAYSLLYPYTDNLLDAPDIASEVKLHVYDRFGRRLRGEALAAQDEREAVLFALVERIEGQYPPAAYPDLHRSLVAIHAAQRASLMQHEVRGDGPGCRDTLLEDAGLGDLELLHVSIRKGGASVLADGYITAGTLASHDADFLFGFGAALQLMDDLQDVREDRARGHATIFTRALDAGPIDGPACRLLAFIDRVLARGRRFARADGAELRDLIRRSCRLLVLHAIADQPEAFSPAFRERIERHSPFGFEFLRDRRVALAPRLQRLRDVLARPGELEAALDDVA